MAESRRPALTRALLSGRQGREVPYTAWRLDARFHAAVGSEALELTARLADGPWLDLCDCARLATGSANREWTVVEVAYGVAHVLSDGRYAGTVVYTLTQP